MSQPARPLPPAVRVYAAYDALYYSFYFAGLARLGVDVELRCEPFPDFGSHGLAVQTVEPDSQVRPKHIFISASDGPVLNAAASAWCDVYGKVNLDPAHVPEEMSSRCLAIGPSFPIRFLSPISAALRSVATFVRCRNRLRRSREHFANYYRQLRYRLPLDAYEPSDSMPDYAFFASTLWAKEAATNEFRARFVRVGRQISHLRFEGGFVPRRSGEVPGFHDVTTERRYSAGEYLSKTKRSAFVFNTPAVSSCHGWKLGEFLALGKAIISTPLSRAMPADLEHGVHVHFVDGSAEAIRDAAERLLRDVDYRKRLESGARSYYLRYLSPERVMRRILDAAYGDSQ